MSKVTVSTKVQPETSEKLAETGYPISVVMQALIEHFLNLPTEEQREMVWDQTQKNIKERAIRKYYMNKENS